jgi:hypothetical protein
MYFVLGVDKCKESQGVKSLSYAMYARKVSLIALT